MAKYCIIFYLLFLSILNSLACVDDSRSTSITDTSSCSGAFDLLILLDSGKEIDENEFDTSKLIITEFIKKLNVGEDKVHVGVISYADRVKLVQPLLTTNQTFELIENRINEIEQLDVSSWTPFALNFAKTVFNSSDRSSNTLIPKITILFTNGNVKDNEIKLLRKEANSLKNLCHVLTVGIGKNIKKNILKMIASCPNYLINSDRLHSLTTKIVCGSCSNLDMNKKVNLKLNKNEMRYFYIKVVNFERKSFILEVHLKKKHGNLYHHHSFTSKHHSPKHMDLLNSRNKNQNQSNENYVLYYNIPYGTAKLYFTLKGVEDKNEFDIIAKKKLTHRKAKKL